MQSRCHHVQNSRPFREIGCRLFGWDWKNFTHHGYEWPMNDPAQHTWFNVYIVLLHTLAIAYLSSSPWDSNRTWIDTASSVLSSSVSPNDRAGACVLGWWQKCGTIGTFSGKLLKNWNDICPYCQRHLLPRWNGTFHIVGLRLNHLQLGSSKRDPKPTLPWGNSFGTSRTFAARIIELWHGSLACCTLVWCGYGLWEVEVGEFGEFTGIHNIDKGFWWMVDACGWRRAMMMIIIIIIIIITSWSQSDHKGGCTTRALPRVKLQGSSAWYLEKCVGLAWSGALGDSKTNWQLAPDDQAILK